MKKLISLLVILAGLFIASGAMKAQNCYLSANYEANGLTVILSAQLFSIEVNQQDSTFQEIDAQYLWIVDNSTFSGQNVTFTFQGYGQHFVTVTGSGQACSATSTMMIYLDENNPGDTTSNFYLYIEGDYYSSEICDASIMAYAIGGVPPISYYWSNGSTTNYLNELCAGEYCVTAVDADGFTAESCFSVSLGNNDTIPNDTTYYNNIYVNISYFSNSVEDCSVSAFANVYGGTPPYMYLWNTGATTPQISDVCTGQEVCLSVVDAAGNAVTACVIILPDSVVNTDTILNGDNPWESTIEWPGDSVFSEAQIVDYWITDTEICFLWALIYENDYQETMTICYPLTDSLGDGWYTVIIHVVYNNGLKANFSFIDNVLLTPSEFSSIQEPEQIIEVSAYPNPVEDILNISFSNQGNDVQLRIFDITGKMMFEALNSDSDLMQLNTSGWSKGVYLIEVQTSTQRTLTKIVK